ncbi:AAA family ATPase [Aminicella lysinilytica]|uniref:5-methylcytosine-specific restriction protein B n=1 Tax=Aminicella lysinilytica TaxID=433323 RepID=A0A4R6Q5Y4_9FIRM|nr:AAA family ATPase [Aminicella lysinilytica]TDP56419.1 5-methylcytosine-specific restriction protein B [Aminicella lysinilytica]
MEKQNNKSNAAFLHWMKPILTALKELEGQGKPQDVRSIIAKNEHLTEEELSETRGKNNVNKFENEVAFARNYLVAGGYIDKSTYGIWKLTDEGWNVDMTDKLASDIFKQGVTEMKEKRERDADYQWVDFYMEFADVLLKFKDNRSALIEKIKEVYASINLRLPKLEENNEIVDIDPFTIFALFNKGITNDNRVRILTAIAKIFDVNAEVPVAFDGIPVVNNLKATFYYFKDGREEQDIDNLWELFYNAIQYADSLNEPYKSNMQKYYDEVKKQKGVNWNITMGLYWIRPNTFINLDSRNREFLNDVDNMPHYFTVIFSNVNKGLPDGASYFFMCEQARNALKNEEYPYHSFPELSYYAWKSTTDENGNEVPSSSVDSNVKETDYWMYSPGDGASMWDEFSKSGIMGIGWDEISNLSEFKSKDAIKEKLKATYDASYSYKNAAHCLWQFANEMKIGDIIFAKKGMHKIVGRGVVSSEYIYDDKREEYRHIRKVSWEKIGEWELPNQAAMKTLTNITSYADTVNEILNLFIDETEEITEEKDVKYPPYDKNEFLDEVFMEEEVYNTLVGLIETKYNVILQGAPGVGKTFAAKRLAYSIMGEKNTSRVSMIQFHQSYSYEDFIQGYRPDKAGFKLENGTFYEFCKTAEEDDEHPYFFIIDEINRGNLSKILGELMMLIEKDKRGEKIKLLYKNEWFTVPKNIRIIGMMNTADRSLALMDYALRRRFAFFNFAPAFSSEGFKRYVAEKNNEKFEKLISQIENLNKAISDDESLGDGFRIGHSYFCTENEITDEWLKSVVEYEIIPLIQEYWFDEPTKVKDWSETLRRTI